MTEDEGQGRRDAWTSSAATTATTCSTSTSGGFNAEVPLRGPVGRPRDDATTGTPASWLEDAALPRVKSVRPAGRAGAAGLLRVHRRSAPHAADPERIYRPVPLRPAARGVRARPAELPRAEHGQPPAGAGAATAFLGRRAACVAEASACAASKATWKVIASDMPIGLVVRDGAERTSRPSANADAGPPLGRELEIADLLRFLKDRAGPQRRLADGRRPLRGGAPLRPGAGPVRTSSTRSGSSWPARCTPGRSGPAELDETFGPEVKFLASLPG